MQQIQLTGDIQCVAVGFSPSTTASRSGGWTKLFFIYFQNLIYCSSSDFSRAKFSQKIDLADFEKITGPQSSKTGQNCLIKKTEKVANLAYRIKI